MDSRVPSDSARVKYSLERENFQKKVHPYPFVTIPAGNFSTIIVKMLILNEHQISFH